ncbi:MULTISPECIES: type II toxin-antitoxin system PemK/MazF family toxin [Nostocales]|uniref:type II toxin-antitoxin system PemK/MazF family toxin n=1 Tax=Nostocales TaxID=1161 RepID=UPI00029B5B6F|nr:type II toxin-antitoxin system PemK/MazF family toxin [Anabaena sp. 90]MBO1052722.1 type II toxin-antitoxin system PemK/MazF family toxin [Dolichospermum sp. DET73]MTJ15801.1 type II toxin-antitoxin system PemK/MazF family toxin [Dolichospermum sp. UHCC 0299]MTJ20006.1 type II toxin-antitoxin system PemK/MazF family toxin [Dolichospermum sp. UHCC 0352]MTJ38191.1 type II toxin-antitoxin system PemK/MazF family toxin [Dolichospermum sp. UHCC 0406]AFW94615.1 growth inhibitor protein [Anabaena 
MLSKGKIIYPQRGEIYLVNFDPTIGSEIRKTRPALILQNDVSNQYSPVTIVAALTSQFTEPLYPTEVIIKVPEGGLQVDSVALLNQIRSIDKQRLIKRLGVLESVTMEQVDRAIQISLGLVNLT